MYAGRDSRQSAVLPSPADGLKMPMGVLHGARKNVGEEGEDGGKEEREFAPVWRQGTGPVAESLTVARVFIHRLANLGFPDVMIPTSRAIAAAVSEKVPCRPTRETAPGAVRSRDLLPRARSPRWAVWMGGTARNATSRAPTVALVAVGDTDNVGREITEEILIAMNSENNCVGRTRCAEVPIPSSRASPAPTAGVGRDGVSRGLTITPYAERPPRSRPRPPTSFRPLVLVIVGDHRVGKD
ncbi:hypothetical protein GGX14DRAFT_643139 [Mycena pura]|uniref:Uncharacterized protein n=1 Tax=Mycena pura TaxID=153505 RepID=A0AAD7E439_9AGAR|nr:hypothetical protein GGX14DRAFT_643139 [Mycena pura]